MVHFFCFSSKREKVKLLVVGLVEGEWTRVGNTHVACPPRMFLARFKPRLKFIARFTLRCEYCLKKSQYEKQQGVKRSKEEKNVEK